MAKERTARSSEPTARQAEVLDVVARLTRETGESPSARHVAAAMGCARENVMRLVKELVAKGYLVQPVVEVKGPPVLSAEGRAFLRAFGRPEPRP